jgi:BlaI family transcriptional regulator, penicillinase repressor
MRQTCDISEAEWKVMKVLWHNGPKTAAEIIGILTRSESWHPSTVKTLLGRLRDKKILANQGKSKPFRYVPLIEEEVCLRAQSENFLQRFFGGSIQPLLVHFFNGQKLSSNDLDELRRILNKGGKP